jgi:hypothetical protein
MNEPLNDLYAQYVQAISFFNAQLEQKLSSDSKRDLLRTDVLSPVEFANWWASVSADHDLQSRWLARFADPAGHFAQTCERISSDLDRIPIRRVAA